MIMGKCIYNGHVGMADIDFNFKPVVTPKPIVLRDVDPMLEAIFSVDSTGHPRSDALVYLQKDTRPEIKDYIVHRLSGPSADVTGGSYSDPDSVMEMMQRYDETPEQWSKRLVEVATEHLKNKG